MRWVIAVGLFAVVIVVGILSSGRSGGDTAELVDRVKGALSEKGLPQPMTDCMGRRLGASLDNEEIAKLYDSPRGVREGTAAVVANPKVQKAIVKSGIACALQLEKGSRLNRQALIEALRGLGEPA